MLNKIFKKKPKNDETKPEVDTMTHMKSFGKQVLTVPAQMTSADLATVLGAGAGFILGGPIGALVVGGAAAVGSRFSKKSKRKLMDPETAAKLENWSKDGHYRKFHREELLKAIKNKDEKSINYHRHHMIRWQNRMMDNLLQAGMLNTEIVYYDDNGNEVKAPDVDQFRRIINLDKY